MTEKDSDWLDHVFSSANEAFAITPASALSNFREKVAQGRKQAQELKDKQQAKEKEQQAQLRNHKLIDGTVVKVAFELNAGQKNALDNLVHWAGKRQEPSFVLKGYAGTGKTTILKLFVAWYQKTQRKALVLAAPTHRAKQVLFKLAGNRMDKDTCMTVHTLLALRPDFEMEQLDLRNLDFQKEGADKMPPDGLVIIDETSMLNDGVVDVLEAYAKRKNTLLLYVGDPAQLMPVKQATISKVFNIERQAELREVMRQKDGNPLGYVLEGIRNNQLVPEDSYQRFDRVSSKGEGIRFSNSSSECRAWVDGLIQEVDLAVDPMHVRILAGTNRMVENYNRAMRAARYADEPTLHEYMPGEILSGYANYGSDILGEHLITNSADYIVIKAERVEKELLEDFPVMGWQLTFREPDNEDHRRVFILSRSESQATLSKLGHHLRNLQQAALHAKKLKKDASKLWARFHEFKDSFCTPADYKQGQYTYLKKTLDYGYAMTVHKSQGGTYVNVLVDEADIDGAFGKDHQLRHQLKYVGFSRASRQVLCLTQKPIVAPTYDF